jgi:hypothetical protein
MTDPTPAAAPGQLVKIGTVAAANIVKRLGLAETAVDTVEKAIADEINSMSSHFTLAVADVQTQYEADTAKLKADYEKAVVEVKSVFTYVKANKVKVASVLGAVAAVAGVLGHLV